MKVFRLMLGAMAGWVAVLGFDRAALARVNHQGRAAGLAVLDVAGHGLVLLRGNAAGLQPARAAGRNRRDSPAEWLGGPVVPMALRAAYLLALLPPILVILLLRSGPA